jgi:hypothetical protein
MTLRLWEVVVAVIVLALAALFFAGGDPAGGVALLVFAIIGAASRARIVERPVAGSYSRARGIIGVVITSTLLAAYGVVVVLFVIAATNHWMRSDRGRVAVYALTGLQVLLYLEMRRRGDEAVDYLIGGRTERKVGAELDKLKSEGWQVVHNLKMDWGGNVDHLVWGERGAYAIETKSGRYSRSAVSQAARNAAWAKEKFGARWVTPVLCVGSEPPQRPEERNGVWVLSLEQLGPWLSSQQPTTRGIPLPPNRS